MAKPVSIRPHYRDDAAFLLRLETAIKKDTRLPEAWREETCKQMRALSQRLLEANVNETLAPQEPIVAAAPGKQRAGR